jgi:hypothetical protein
MIDFLTHLHHVQWPQVGQVDYEEWFESVDIGSVPLSAVAYVVADLYRDLFEVCVPRARPPFFF